jgi:hypothetical protein
MKTNKRFITAGVLALALIFGLTVAACGGGGGGAAAAVKGTGKNYTMSKPEDFKYDLTKIDGKDYVVIQDVNVPSGFQKPKAPEDSESGKVNIDTLTVIIPEKIEGYTVGVIDEDALAGMIITAVTIPDTVVEIRDGAFKNASISSIKLPKNLTEIPEKAFAGCTSLKEIVIPDSVTVIGDGAFNNCKELTTVKLPSHAITYEGFGTSSYSFAGCPRLSLAERKAIQDSGYPGKF